MRSTSSSETSRRALEVQVVGLPADQPLRGAEQAGKRAPAVGVVAHQRLDGAGQHRVAGEDRLALAEDGPPGRTVAPFEIAVHDVVVQQREVVHQLDGDRAGQRRRRRCRRPPRPTAPPGSGGSPCRRRSRPGCRPGRTSRAGRTRCSRIRASSSVPTAARSACWTERAHAADCLRVRCDSCGDLHSLLGGTPSASSAAAMPLRTALSIVSGQPVAVHDPASHRPSRPDRLDGRNVAVPAA